MVASGRAWWRIDERADCHATRLELKNNSFYFTQKMLAKRLAHDLPLLRG
jgi:hypothetical protein